MRSQLHPYVVPEWATSPTITALRVRAGRFNADSGTAVAKMQRNVGHAVPPSGIRNTFTCMLAARLWSARWRPRGVGTEANQRINPMQSKLPMHLSRRCGARIRNGSRCRSPAMPNGRCRMHGGPSPGAPKGNRNAFKHGRYTIEAIANRREIAALLRTMRASARATECD